MTVVTEGSAFGPWSRRAVTPTALGPDGPAGQEDAPMEVRVNGVGVMSGPGGVAVTSGAVILAVSGVTWSRLIGTRPVFSFPPSFSPSPHLTLEKSHAVSRANQSELLRGLFRVPSVSENGGTREGGHSSPQRAVGVITLSPSLLTPWLPSQLVTCPICGSGNSWTAGVKDANLGHRSAPPGRLNVTLGEQSLT